MQVMVKNNGARKIGNNGIPIGSINIDWMNYFNIR